MSPSIPRISNGDAQMIEEFIKDLEATSEQVQKLLDTVRASELDFAAIKTELRILCENVKDISSLLRDGDGGVSLVTRIALLEQKIKELEKDIERDQEKKDGMDRVTHKSLSDIILAEKAEKAADTKGKWELRIALATGIISLLTSVIATIAAHYK